MFPIDFTRGFLYLFIFLGLLFIATEGSHSIGVSSIALACLATLFFITVLSTFDLLAKYFSLKALNTFILGSLIGYLFTLSFNYCLDQLLSWTPLLLPASKVIVGFKFCLIIFGIYFGIHLVARAADEIYLSIPLVRFRFENHKKRDILLDRSILFDQRLLDVAATGIFDDRLILPKFLVKDLQNELMGEDELSRTQARKALDLVQSLELLARLNLRYDDHDFPEIDEAGNKLIKIARALDADILCSQATGFGAKTLEDIRIINLQTLAKAMNPPTTVGDDILVKVLKTGKDKKNGIAYLEDGTMVVVNSGAEYVGQTILVHLISLKHTLSGRVFFSYYKNHTDTKQLHEKDTVLIC